MIKTKAPQRCKDQYTRQSQMTKFQFTPNCFNTADMRDIFNMEWRMNNVFCIVLSKYNTFVEKHTFYHSKNLLNIILICLNKITVQSQLRYIFGVHLATHFWMIHCPLRSSTICDQGT